MQLTPDQPVTILALFKIGNEEIRHLKELGYKSNRVEVGMGGSDGGFDAVKWDELVSPLASVFSAQDNPSMAIEMARRAMPDVVLFKDDAAGRALRQSLLNESCFVAQPVRPGQSVVHAIVEAASSTPTQRRLSAVNSSGFSLAALAR